MNTLQEYMYEQVKNDWENFPWKLDYILHKLFSEYENIADISFLKHNDIYSVNLFRDTDLDHHYVENIQYSLHESEILQYLGITQTGYNDFLQFTYNAKIFTDQPEFIGQKSTIIGEKYIVLRLKRMNGQNIDFSNFNEKLANHKLYYDLGERLQHKINYKGKAVKI